MQSFNFTFRYQKWVISCTNCVFGGACDCNSRYVYKLGTGDIVGISLTLPCFILFVYAFYLLFRECYKKPPNIPMGDKVGTPMIDPEHTDTFAELEQKQLFNRKTRGNSIPHKTENDKNTGLETSLETHRATDVEQDLPNDAVVTFRT